ncbi:MAG: AAA family ATPase [Chitinophagaceae bacterium]|nr:AAA family ATPase [Chitinophagaceae bacterium]
MPDVKLFDLKNIQTTADLDPRNYVIDDKSLAKAVNMAIWLQKPLLVTGAPGTGKTQLAFKVAHELNKMNTLELNGFAEFAATPLIFNTKTTSNASDLFYSYDAIGHFQKKHVDQVKENGTAGNQAHPFIQLNALGKAILQTYGKENILADENLRDLQLLKNFSTIEVQPSGSVVLIDEIDKAPRDFPNDLLNEIEHYEFMISELNNIRVRRAVQKENEPTARIVVIMTSNFEKNLPDAFLRRCLFYHIPSPTEEALYKIVCARMQPYLKVVYKDEPEADVEKKFKNLQDKVSKVISEFQQYKEKMMEKPPSNAELLEWIKVLEIEGFFSEDVDFKKLSANQKTILQYTLPIIAKSKDDKEKIAG